MSELSPSNLVARLRRRAITQAGAVDPVVDELLEAADTIERLTRELDDQADTSRAASSRRRTACALNWATSEDFALILCGAIAPAKPFAARCNLWRRQRVRRQTKRSTNGTHAKGHSCTRPRTAKSTRICRGR